MSQSSPNKYPRASAALAGLGLTNQLAAAATDNIPIARLVLGVVSRIITLAEDIETSRDAPHQLAESARTMGLSISAVVAERQMSPEVERRLEAIYEVLRSIETFFTRHKAKSAFQKALSYAFTTKKRVESLSQELSRATQELLCIAVVDTNAHVREDPRYIGEFRRIRLCDVDDLTLISEHKFGWTGCSSQIYSGRFKGKAVALRFLQQKGDHTCGEWLRELVREHDRILEDISTDPSLHRNIARLYGMNSREYLDRFNVMKSVCFGISKFNERPATIASTWNIISQLLDATIWLEDKGISWYPEWPREAILIGSGGAPIIGLNNDLCLCDTKERQIYVLKDMLRHAYSAHWELSLLGDQALDIILGTAPVPRETFRKKITVPRRLIPTLNAKISTYITNTLQGLQDPLLVWACTGAVILHAAASGCNVGSTFYTTYLKNMTGPFDDYIFMARVDERDTELVHWTVRTGIPTSMSETFRKKLGITMEGLPNLPGVLESYRDPSEPASMQFKTMYPRRRA